MNLYVAPLEGITTYTYRNTHHELFGGADAYFAPFINPSDQEKVSKKGVRDILPEKNGETPLKIQVLTNSAESFLKFEKKVQAIGYKEINLNVGCPAQTVVKKGRGAGFLQDPDGMDRFFDEVFSKTEAEITVKTRIGYESADEMESLLQIYNRYPIKTLIVHPRTRQDFYGGVPDMEMFRMVYKESKHPIVYNGDVYTKEDFEKIKAEFPRLDGVMMGRGILKNLALLREIQGGAPLKDDELLAFSEELSKRYMEVLRSETFTLYKLKEIWVYILQNYPEEKKIAKTIKKAKTIEEFMTATKMLFQ